MGLGEALGETLGNAPGSSWTLSAICLPHTSSLQVRGKRSACCRGATFPLLCSPSLSHFTQRAYEVGVTLVAQINLKLKPGPKGSGPVIFALCASYAGFTALP